MEPPWREKLFDQYRGEGWEAEYKQYRENWKKYPKYFFVSDYPLLVDLELSSVCNLSCPMCFSNSKHYQENIHTGFMDFNLFTKVIDEIAGKVPAIRLSLRGESTLNPNFTKAIDYAKNKGIKEVSTLTNGSTLTKEFIAQIVTARIDWITISIDGIGEEYENIRKPLRFLDIFSKIKDIYEIKKQLNIHRPVIKIQSIWPAIKDNPEEFYNLFYPYVDLIAFNPLIDYLGNDQDILYEENFACPQLYQRIIIFHDGNATMCTNDEEMHNNIGNANIQTIHEIWHGEKIENVRLLHKKDNGFLNIQTCQKCFLPRLTEDNETACVNGRKFIIKNYVNRTQKIGE
jgi:radical SAM protein with 4Fe4S-binding SPASM domain